MKADRLNPELRSIYRFVPNMPIKRKWSRALVRKALTALPPAKLPEGVTSEVIPVPGGVSVRVFTPRGGGSGGALLYMHGGGMVIGAAAQEDVHVARLAAELDIVAISVEYRLAPETPFPGPLDDCFAAWEWLQREAQTRGIDPNRVVVGGQSAGGGLAAGLVQRIHDKGGAQPLGQWLFCPMLDDRTAARRELDSVKNFLWNNASNLIGWRSYLGTEPGAAAVPQYAAPSRREDLAGLPPAWIGTGDIELFFEEDRSYAQALTAAGVACALNIVPGAPHAFESVAMNTQLAKGYTAHAEEWLRDRFQS